VIWALGHLKYKRPMAEKRLLKNIKEIKCFLAVIRFRTTAQIISAIHKKMFGQFFGQLFLDQLTLFHQLCLSISYSKYIGWHHT
jgi:hypothetical protein